MATRRGDQQRLTISLAERRTCIPVQRPRFERHSGCWGPSADIYSLALDALAGDVAEIGPWKVIATGLDMMRRYAGGAIILILELACAMAHADMAKRWEHYWRELRC